jgi:hypothetical protein
MVTVATRVEPQEVERLKELASECGLSVCAYMRDMIRLELGRANRAEARANGESLGTLNGDSPKLELAS